MADSTSHEFWCSAYSKEYFTSRSLSISENNHQLFFQKITISYFLISKVILRWNILLSMLNIKTRGWSSPPSWSAFGRKWSAFSFASANFIQRNSNGYLLAIYICKAICLSAVIYIRIQDPWLVGQPSAMTVLAESARSVIGQLQAITVQPDAIAARCGLTLDVAVWPLSNI